MFEEMDLDEWDLDRAMLNSYNLIFRGYDPFLIIHSQQGWFAHDPSEKVQIEDLEGMLEYYEDLEDYIKCKEIQEYINKKWNLENTKKK